MKFHSIKIETDRVDKVKNHIASTRQTISGFIALAIDEKLKKESELPSFISGFSNFPGGLAFVDNDGPEMIREHK